MISMLALPPGPSGLHRTRTRPTSRAGRSRSASGEISGGTSMRGRRERKRGPIQVIADGRALRSTNFTLRSARTLALFRLRLNKAAVPFVDECLRASNKLGAMQRGIVFQIRVGHIAGTIALSPEQAGHRSLRGPHQAPVGVKAAIFDEAPKVVHQETQEHPCRPKSSLLPTESPEKGDVDGHQSPGPSSRPRSRAKFAGPRRHRVRSATGCSCRHSRLRESPGGQALP